MRTSLLSTDVPCSAGGAQAAMTRSLRCSSDWATLYVPDVSMAMRLLMYISADSPMMETLSLAASAAFTASATEPGSHVVRDESSTSASRMPYGGTNDTACNHAHYYILLCAVQLIVHRKVLPHGCMGTRTGNVRCECSAWPVRIEGGELRVG